MTGGDGETPGMGWMGLAWAGRLANFALDGAARRTACPPLRWNCAARPAAELAGMAAPYECIPMADEKDGKTGGGLSRLKIAKKAYVFDVRKKYAVTKNFTLKKKAETPAEEIKENLEAIFGKSRLGQKMEKKLAPLQQMPPAASSASAATKTAAVVAGLALLAFLIWLGLTIYSLSGSEEAAAMRSSIFAGNYTFTIAQSDLLSVMPESTPVRSPYFLVRYSSQNLSFLNFSVKLYLEKPPSQVFLLDHSREGSEESYPMFRKRLLEGLREQGLSANEIGLERLGNLPGGAVLVVPTGYPPLDLLDESGPFGYKKMLSRGVTIIYIGQEFDHAIDRTGASVPFRQSDLTFSRSRQDSTGGFNLFDARYLVAPSGSGTGFSQKGQYYGTVSALRYGSGTLLFLPQTLDGGWRSDGQLAASDLVRLIVEKPWLAPVSEINVTAKPSADDGGLLSMFAPTVSSDRTYAEFVANAADPEGILSRRVAVFPLIKRQKGEMYPRDPATVPYYLSGQKTRLSVELRENYTDPVKLYIKMYKDGGVLQEDELEFGLTNPTTDKSKDIQVNAEPGSYVVKVEDDTGKVYAACRLDVADLFVELKQPSWQKGTFVFLLSSQGKPVTPRTLAVTMDGRSEKKYSPSSYRYNADSTEIDYEYPGEIAAGQHEFMFLAGEYGKTLQSSYVKPTNLWDNPLVLILGALSLLVFAVGWIMRRPEKLRYGLDIPDFPPLSTIRIPLQRSVVLEIFNSVNEGYSWQWMPLRIEELKNGFRRLTHNGKPILIGDFNLERILSKLREEGLVAENLGYWGLKQWEAQSNHSLRYLTIYRILRNVFVNNAVKFSKLGAVPECDVKAIAGKEEVYLQIMEPPYEKAVHRALMTARRGTTIMVFATEEERDSFRASLTSTSKLAVALKMEMNGGHILLLPVKNAISAFLKGVVR